MRKQLINGEASVRAVSAARRWVLCRTLIDIRVICAPGEKNTGFLRCRSCEKPTGYRSVRRASRIVNDGTG
jgi:hypothetical protein